MHACMAYLLGSKTPKNVPITAESNMCDISKEFESGNPRQEKTCVSFFEREKEGSFYGQMGMYCCVYCCYML